MEPAVKKDKGRKRKQSRRRMAPAVQSVLHAAAWWDSLVRELRFADVVTKSPRSAADPQTRRTQQTSDTDESRAPPHEIWSSS